MPPKTHAEHAPPKPESDAPVHPPLSFGALYPEGDIHAVIDDREEAERAVQALRAAGIPGSTGRCCSMRNPSSRR